jgi:uncharacterized protein YneF (UPF0154 family)
VAKSGVSMNTIVILMYAAVLFGLGVFTGIYIEAQHRMRLRAKFRAMHGPTIEEQMWKDGWRI